MVVKLPASQRNGIGLIMKTGMLGDAVGKKHTVLHVSKPTRNSFNLARLYCEKIGLNSSALNVVGFSPKWDYLVSQFTDMAKNFETVITVHDILNKVLPEVSMLHLPYLGDSPTEEECYDIRIKADAAAGDLGSISIQDSFIKHSKHPGKQGSLAATMLEFCILSLRDIKAGKFPKIESLYKVGHRERTIKAPKVGVEKQVQTRTVCAPSANVKVLHSLYLQAIMNSWKGTRLRKSCI